MDKDIIYRFSAYNAVIGPRVVKLVKASEKPFLSLHPGNADVDESPQDLKTRLRHRNITVLVPAKLLVCDVWRIYRLVKPAGKPILSSLNPLILLELFTDAIRGS